MGRTRGSFGVVVASGRRTLSGELIGGNDMNLSIAINGVHATA